ncbi:MAG: glycosyltransferase family 4 protein [Chloroflexi bacterium]|nr:glycosyltransferase family 4 protein [Chloroflexota bacterium]MCL5076413.1 glycosyltransferase family 4 protein [Chloroflexota bacterium]
MKVLFLTYGTKIVASSRTRVYQYLPYLEQEGIGYKVIPLLSEEECQRAMLFPQIEKSPLDFTALRHKLGRVLRVLLFLALASHFDVLFIQKVLLPIGLQKMVQRLNGKIIFDFDDAIYASHPTLIGLRSTARAVERLARSLKMSRYVILENRYTAEFASQYNRNIVMITGPIDTEYYRPRQDKGSAQLVIGWVGSPPNTVYLEPLYAVFRQLCRRYKDLSIELVGAGPVGLAGVPLLIKPWRSEGEVQDLQRFDIGLMPLPDDEWSRGKGGYKLLQYMAIGIPSVASPVGINCELIQEGTTGFLADSPEEWVEKLSLLIENGELRHQMGMVGRRLVEEHYSLRASAPQFLETIRATAARY